MLLRMQTAVFPVRLPETPFVAQQMRGFGNLPEVFFNPARQKEMGILLRRLLFKDDRPDV